MNFNTSFDSSGMRLDPHPAYLDPDVAEPKPIKPKQQTVIHPWFGMDSMISYNSVQAIQAEVKNSEDTSDSYFRMLEKYINAIVASAIFSYTFGSFFSWASRIAPKIFVRPISATRNSIKSVGKLIPPAMVFAAELVFYTMPKKFVTEVVPQVWNRSLLAISAINRGFNLAAAWLGNHVLPPVVESSRKTWSTVTSVIGDGLFSFRKNFAVPAAKYVTKAVTKTKTVVEETSSWLQNFLAPLIEYGKAAWKPIKEVITQTVRWIGKKIIQPVAHYGTKVLTFTDNVLRIATAWIANRILVPVLKISEDFRSSCEKLFSSAANWFKETLLPPMSKFLEAVGSAAYNLAKQSLDWMKEVFAPAFDAAAALFKFAGSQVIQAATHFYNKFLAPGFAAFAAGARYMGEAFSQAGKALGRASSYIGKKANTLAKAAKKEIGNFVGWLKGLFSSTA